MTPDTLRLYLVSRFQMFKENGNALGQHKKSKKLIIIIIETTVHDNSISDQSVHQPVRAF